VVCWDLGDRERAVNKFASWEERGRMAVISSPANASYKPLVRNA
jgi:hypothetical protein